MKNILKHGSIHSLRSYSPRTGLLNPFVLSRDEVSYRRMQINNISSAKILRVMCYALLSFLFLINAQTNAMLGEGSFVGTGGYAIGGTPYHYAGLSYYYNPDMDYNWDGQQWIFETGAQWPPRCCKPNACTSCGYQSVTDCQCEESCVEKCWSIFKNYNAKG